MAKAHRWRDRFPLETIQKDQCHIEGDLAQRGGSNVRQRWWVLVRNIKLNNAISATNSFLPSSDIDICITTGGELKIPDDLNRVADVLGYEFLLIEISIKKMGSIF